MRIFPEGVQDGMRPCGKAIIIIAACMLAVAVVAFGLKTWILYTWPRTTGTVINNRVETSTSDDGTELCSLVELVGYVVDGRNLVVETGGHTFTNACPGIREKVAESKGQIRTVVYNKYAPGATYVNPGFNIEFYLVAFVLTCLAAAFGLAGRALIAIYDWMARRGFKLR